MRTLKLCIIILIYVAIICCATYINNNPQPYVSRIEHMANNVCKYTVSIADSSDDYMIIYTDCSVFKIGDPVKFNTIKE